MFRRHRLAIAAIATTLIGVVVLVALPYLAVKKAVVFALPYLAVRNVAANFVDAAARGDSARVSELSIGEEPKWALGYIHFLRPDFLKAAAESGRQHWPTLSHDSALTGIMVRYRDGEDLHLDLANIDGRWVVTWVHIPHLWLRLPHDPENQPDWRAQREARFWPGYNKHYDRR